MQLLSIMFIYIPQHRTGNGEVHVLQRGKQSERVQADIPVTDEFSRLAVCINENRAMTKISETKLSSKLDYAVASR